MNAEPCSPSASPRAVGGALFAICSDEAVIVGAHARFIGIKASASSHTLPSPRPTGISSNAMHASNTTPVGTRLRVP